MDVDYTGRLRQAAKASGVHGGVTSRDCHGHSREVRASCTVVQTSYHFLTLRIKLRIYEDFRDPFAGSSGFRTGPCDLAGAGFETGATYSERTYAAYSLSNAPYRMGR